MTFTEAINKFVSLHKSNPAISRIGISRSADGRDAISVYVTDRSLLNDLPLEFEGFPIIISIVNPQTPTS